MKVMILTCSPNIEGLTAACGSAAKTGAEAAGAQVDMVNLNRLKIGHCQACGNGWGPCRNEHECQVQDDFQSLHVSMADADAFVLITPVYWGDMSESAKAFTDRLRRCEAFRNDRTFLQDKPFLAVAAAGGSGNGLTSCLTSMERFLMHVKAEKFDLIGITQRSRGYKLDTIHAAARQMVSLGLKL
ncbi:NADPH-dependent FMN reductase [Acididesulfobacillus acetoxydans]|uniref:NADPH-dependent FMN reductase n=1 Tax=Acididesulfobacillus acetoxydans TaxID=1561005 RepID=A0A8S0W6Y0_9FIRM|nr:flavodoxin family protein [Acididesulfobacillus acetoxydans]CAA7600229.1 NADPH-dependent FMN reductase [Acididesulfobacillus acetoxydans]CEJ09607.1 NADPH-dependent FMN reductase protein [Acididesulfobacillus acetoxydans]